jgi:hypothetical protein
MKQTARTLPAGQGIAHIIVEARTLPAPSVDSLLPP